MISATNNAINKILQQIKRRGKGLGVRVGVKTTGCSGLAYVLEYVDTANDDDIKIDCSGCTIFLDPKSCPYIKGMTIDYEKNGLAEGFTFNNPLERDRCGCGSSFRI